MPTYPTTIPPLLPHQVQVQGSAAAGSANTATISVVKTALRVDCTFGTAGPTGRSTQWSWGDDKGPVSYQASQDNTAGHTYNAAGTYTIWASDGQRNGTVDVTVTAVQEDPEGRKGKRAARESESDENQGLDQDEGKGHKLKDKLWHH